MIANSIIEASSSRSLVARAFTRLELVGDAAEQLCQHILERDQTGHTAPLVDHERLVTAPLAEECQQAIGGHGVAHADDRPQQ